MEGLIAALEGKQNSLSVTNKLPSSFIVTTPASTGVAEVTLDTTLAGKQNLLTSASKLFFSDIVRDAFNQTTSVSSYLGTPTIRSGTSTTGFTTTVGTTTTTHTWDGATVSGYSIGSIIGVRISTQNVTTSNAFERTVLSTLPSGTWSGCVQFIFTKGSGYTWSTLTPLRIQLQFTPFGTVDGVAATLNTNDFFPVENSHQANYITNSATVSWQVNIPVLFRCVAGRPNVRLEASMTVPIAGSNTNYTTYTTTLSLTKIAL